MNAYNETMNYPVADSSPSERAAFIRRTYAHLAGAIVAFALLQGVLFNTGIAQQIAGTMFSFAPGYSWLIILGLFMGVSWLANSWATSDTSRTMQYAGLGLYIVAEAIIFIPLLFVAAYYAPGAIENAAVVTGGLFAALTAIVFFTRKDFSFLGPILTIAGFVALGAIASSIIFGFSLGTLFAAAMVLFAGGAILYDTSNVLHRYRPDQHVAASLALFASVALLFFYILRLFTGGSRD